MTNTTAVLTVSDLIALSEIASAAEQSAKVDYMDESGTIIYGGTVRAFVQDPSRPYFLGVENDVRDAYLWVTAGGFEHFPSVRHLMKMVHEGGFVINN